MHCSSTSCTMYLYVAVHVLYKLWSRSFCKLEYNKVVRSLLWNCSKILPVIGIGFCHMYLSYRIKCVMLHTKV